MYCVKVGTTAQLLKRRLYQPVYRKSGRGGKRDKEGGRGSALPGKLRQVGMGQPSRTFFPFLPRQAGQNSETVHGSEDSSVSGQNQRGENYNRKHFDVCWVPVCGSVVGYIWGRQREVESGHRRIICQLA